MLYGIIITLSSGYILLLLGGIVYGCVKCVRLTKFKLRQSRLEREIRKIPEPIQLQLMDQVSNYETVHYEFQ